MKKENLIHIKFGYGEALQSKKNLLSLEMNLLKIAQIIQRYRTLRLEELRMKLKLHRKINNVKTNFKKLQEFLPGLQIPKILKESEMSFRKETPSKKNYDTSIENQLQEIQEKLKALS